MTLPRRDLELVETWAEHGMPDDDSTRAHAVELLTKLLADNAELYEVITRLVADDEEEAL